MVPRSSIMPLISLATGTFAIGTTELVVLGLLPHIAADLDVSIPEAGLLVTGYAVGVLISAPIIAVITNGMARKRTLLGLMAVFTMGNALCALAPTYDFLLAARIFTSFAHATFFGIASVTATRIVPPERRASAVAVVFGGVTVAAVFGVPLGTEIGEWFAWNEAFWAVALIGALAVVAIALWLPAKISTERADLRAELAVLRDRHVLVAMLVTALTWGSLFAVYTYITPIFEEVTGMSEDQVILVLFIFGIGMTVGNFVGGRLADWRLLPAIVGMTATVAVALVLFAIVVRVPHLAVVAVVTWGFFVFALAPPLQVWVVTAAGRAPHIASTVNQAAFHIGSATGAWLGASALSVGVAFGHLPWVSLVVTLAALAVAGMVTAMERRRRKTADAEATPSPTGTA